MPYKELINFLEHVGKDPSRLIFEDELTGIHNRRFLRSYLEHKVRWQGDKDYPLSLLIADVDEFKEINDNYGHQIGDQVLTWMATLLKEVAGERGLPIRFGGDEFILLLPKTDRDEAQKLAYHLLQRIWDQPFRLRGAADVDVVPITLSVGVATAPEDARSGKALFQAADTALYYAKQSGRNRAAAAAEIDQQKVFRKTALHRLEAIGVTGRETELAAVSEALEGLSRGNNQFVVFEGAPGMGKTTLLETVRHNLEGNEALFITKVVGDQQEAYQPYYLATRLLIAVMNRREDKGAAALEDLTTEETGYLGRILPQLTSEEEIPESDQHDGATRQRIFATLARFLPRAVDFRPLVLLIDDLQFADEATLLLLRVLMQRQELALFVCGSSLESLRLSGEEEAPPLERFYAAYRKEFEIRRVKLRPLSEDDIEEYLTGVFPNLRTPDRFQAELARITQGNPLFMGEIIRKLVTDRKVNLVGQEWVIEPLEEGYLPRSLEDIVSEKIAALDDEARQLLERASALGEDIPVSILTGSSELDENRVLEFLDRAEALGLVSLDFQANDEVMRFLGKQVLEISYGTIDGHRREELHEQVGNYQEGLYEQRYLPSASLLAYHFKRSANQEKARRYEHVQLANGKTVFDAQEAASYTEEFFGDEGETEKRLDPESIPLVPDVLRTIVTTVRSIQLYPPESETIGRSLKQVTERLEEVLAKNERLHFSQAQRFLLANGQRLDVSGFNALADAFLHILARFELQAMTFLPGITDAEIGVLLTTLGQMKPEAINRGFWKSFSQDNELSHIELQQVRYSRVRKKHAVTSRLLSVEETELSSDELAEIPKILRALQGATKNAMLYPLDSNQVARSIEQLHGSLQGVLDGRQSLTLAGADQALLVNGTRVDTGGFEALAVKVIEFLDSVALGSITFLSHVSSTDLQTFIGALRDPPTTGMDEDFWRNFAGENELAGLAFNQRQYALGVVEGLLQSVEVELGVVDSEEDPTAAVAEQISTGPSEALLEALPRFGRELLVRGEHSVIRRVMQRLFEDFKDRDLLVREETVQACRLLLDRLILGLQNKFAETAADSLISALSEETEPRVLQDLAGVLYAMASSAVQFADYLLASRILLAIKSRREELEAEGKGGARRLTKVLERRLDAAARKLLADDLQSGQPDRQARAALVMGSLGRPAIPLLIEVIKQEKDFRSRQTAASLLAEMGPPAGEHLKRALLTEVIVEQRFRILEVIDTVTRDLRDELAYNLGDESPKIRRAAFRLFERLHEDNLADLVLPMARNDDPDVAKGAIRSLTHLRSAAAVAALVSILNEAKEPEVVIACCQAIGQLGASDGIDAVARVLGQRKFLFLGRRWGEQVRATAAAALKQISDPRAAKILARHAKDRSATVRELAGSSDPVETSSQ